MAAAGAETPTDRITLSTRFGEFEADSRNLLSFPAGLPGFEQCHRFVLLASIEAAPLQVLMSVDGPPASFLAIPFYLIMKHYGLQENPWSVIAALTTFATPYAIFIFQEYGRSIPLELDESARIDGASPIQIYFRIYLPLMAPALVAVGTYAMLLAWNEYLYQFLLLSQKEDMTVPVALAQFLNSDIAPWNYMMATAIIYALPPICIYYTFRHRMSSGLTMGGVKG